MLDLTFSVFLINLIYFSNHLYLLCFLNDFNLICFNFPNKFNYSYVSFLLTEVFLFLYYILSIFFISHFLFSVYSFSVFLRIFLLYHQIISRSFLCLTVVFSSLDLFCHLSFSFFLFRLPFSTLAIFPILLPI